MKSGKILLSIFLIVSFPIEGFKAYLQTNSFGFLISTIIISFVLASLLIKSAYKENSANYLPSKSKIYFWKFVKFLSIIGIIGSLFSLFQNPIKPKPKHVILVNNIKIPLDNCIKMSSAILGDSNLKISYCSCLAEKLSNSDMIIENYKKYLENGQFEVILNDLKNKGKYFNTESCLDTIKFEQLTESAKNELKKYLILRINKLNQGNNYDTIKYSNCVIDKVNGFYARTVLSAEILKTREFAVIDSICLLESSK